MAIASYCVTERYSEGSELNSPYAGALVYLEGEWTMEGCWPMGAEWGSQAWPSSWSCHGYPSYRQDHAPSIDEGYFVCPSGRETYGEDVYSQYFQYPIRRIMELNCAGIDNFLYVGNWYDSINNLWTSTVPGNTGFFLIAYWTAGGYLNVRIDGDSFMYGHTWIYNCTSWLDSDDCPGGYLNGKRKTAKEMRDSSMHDLVNTLPNLYIYNAGNIRKSVLYAIYIDVPDLDITGSKLNGVYNWPYYFPSLRAGFTDEITRLVWDGLTETPYYVLTAAPSPVNEISNSCIYFTFDQIPLYSSDYDISGVEFTWPRETSQVGYFDKLRLIDFKCANFILRYLPYTNSTSRGKLSLRGINCVNNFELWGWTGQYMSTTTKLDFIMDNTVTQNLQSLKIQIYDLVKTTTYASRRVIFKDCTFTNIALTINLASAEDYPARGVFSDTSDGAGNKIVEPLTILLKEIVFDPDLPAEEIDPRILWHSSTSCTFTVDITPSGNKDLAKYNIPTNSLDNTPSAAIESFGKTSKGIALSTFKSKKIDYAKLFSSYTGTTTINNKAVYIEFLSNITSDGDGPPCLL